MLEELNISMSIDVVKKILYIGEESSSGAEYKYKDIKDLEDKIVKSQKNKKRSIFDRIKRGMNSMSKASEEFFDGIK